MFYSIYCFFVSAAALGIPGLNSIGNNDCFLLFPIVSDRNFFSLKAKNCVF